MEDLFFEFSEIFTGFDMIFEDKGADVALTDLANEILSGVFHLLWFVGELVFWYEWGTNFTIKIFIY